MKLRDKIIDEKEISDVINLLKDENSFIVQCCVCKDFRRYNGEWYKPSEPLRNLVYQIANISHTYCKECQKPLYQELNTPQKSRPIGFGQE